MPVAPHEKLLKRTFAQREQDIASIGEMCVKGWNYGRIALWFSQNRPYTLSKAQICIDAKKAVAIWQAAAAERIDTIKARDLARLEAIEREAWNAWEDSRKQSRRTLEEEQSEPDAEAPAPAANPEDSKVLAPVLRRLKRQKRSTITENRDGDPRFLQIIFDCIKQRGVITGYSQPQSILPDGDEKINTDEQRAINDALRIAYGQQAIEVPAQATVTPETATGTTPAPQPVKAPDWVTAAES